MQIDLNKYTKGVYVLVNYSFYKKIYILYFMSIVFILFLFSFVSPLFCLFGFSFINCFVFSFLLHGTVMYGGQQVSRRKNKFFCTNYLIHAVK